MYVLCQDMSTANILVLSFYIKNKKNFIKHKEIYFEQKLYAVEF